VSVRELEFQLIESCRINIIWNQPQSIALSRANYTNIVVEK